MKKNQAKMDGTLGNRDLKLRNALPKEDKKQNQL